MKYKFWEALACIADFFGWPCFQHRELRRNKNAKCSYAFHYRRPMNPLNAWRHRKSVEIANEICKRLEQKQKSHEIAQ